MHIFFLFALFRVSYTHQRFPHTPVDWCQRLLLTVHAHRKPGTDTMPTFTDCCCGNYYGWRLIFFIFFHYETKYGVIFFPPKKESKEVSTARLVHWCALSHRQHLLLTPRDAKIKDQVLPLPHKATERRSGLEHPPCSCCNPSCRSRSPPSQGLVGWDARKPSKASK